MGVLQLLVIFVVFSSARSRPTTESTHALLKRLGFDPVQRTQVNHHSKRVALETNKARYHNNDIYSSNSDSRMFVVKLPPHSPYYSHLKPEKLKNEAIIAEAADPTGSGDGGIGKQSGSGKQQQHSFRTNGKPGQIYHWNIPVLKRLPLEKKGIVRSANEDSKVYRIKILPNLTPAKEVKADASYKKNKRKNKYEDKADNTVKSNKLHRNKFYRFTDLLDATEKNGTEPIIRFRGGGGVGDDGKLLMFQNGGNNKKLTEKYANEVSKTKIRARGPNYYVPAIPKQNSFHKYFTGNGKLKSFYVIEKSRKPTRLHQLL